MPNPDFPTDGQGSEVDALVNADGDAYLKLGVGTKLPFGASTSAAWAGSASHTDGATFVALDGVMLAAGFVAGGTTVKKMLVDANGVLLANAPYPVTVLGTGARTATATQADQTVFGAYRGIVVVLDVTIAGTGSITLSIEGKDPVSGTYRVILAGAAVTTISTNVYKVYPTITAVANSIAQDFLPSVWRVKVTANNGNTITYSVGAVLVP